MSFSLRDLGDALFNSNGLIGEGRKEIKKEVQKELFKAIFGKKDGALTDGVHLYTV